MTSDEDIPSPSINIDGTAIPAISIHETGDLVLIATFETSLTTRRKAAAHRPAAFAKKLAPSRSSGLSTASSRHNPAPTLPKATVVQAFRVQVDVLRRASGYFAHLLDPVRFQEGRDVSQQLTALRLGETSPESASLEALPRISITDDDEASCAAHREAVFADMLRLLHHQDLTTKLTMPLLAVLAVMADRFDCAASISKALRNQTAFRAFKWPPAPVVKFTSHGTPAANGGLPPAAEELLRQKIFAAWMLDQPVRLAAFTKELIIRGSALWVTGAGFTASSAMWWELPDGLEAELFHRRWRILSTIASVPSYYLKLYTSRRLQCRAYLDSSPACDSFELGEMVKFLCRRNLLRLTSNIAASEDDFNYGVPGGVDTAEDPEDGLEGLSYVGSINQLISTMKEYPRYTMDSNHAACGMRKRIVGSLDYIQAMLTSGVGIELKSWKSGPENSSWQDDEPGFLAPSAHGRRVPAWEVDGADAKEGVFQFTRKVGMREGMDASAMSIKFARALFTANDWDWNPEGV